MGCANSTPEKTETENPSNHSAKLQPGSEPAPGGSRKAVSAEEIVARVENAGAVEKAEEEPAATIEESATTAAEEEAAAAKAATELVDSAVSKSLDDLDPEPEPDPEESNLFARLAGTFTKVKGFIGRLRGRKKVVILCTSAEKMPGLDGLTGAWSEEVTTPFYLFTEKGCEVTLASINGGKVPIDAASLGEGFKSESDTKFEENGDLSKLESTVEISSISPDDFDCIFLAGGHGTVVDFPDGAADIVTKAYARGRYVAAVCHGPFGLLNATAHDTALVAGKKVCGFSNEEEAAVVGMRGLDPPPPSLEDALKSLGGEYVPGEAWAPNAIRDGNLITGQNPKSAGKVAELCLEAMGL